MSLCISFFNRGEIYVYADSRVSAEINGVNHRVTDDYRKIHQIGDNVIFLSGDVTVAEAFLDGINEYSTIHDIQRSAQRAYDEYVPANPDSEFGVYIHTLENGVPTYIQLGYHDNFEINRKQPGDMELFAVASKSEMALQLVDKFNRAGHGLDTAVTLAYETLADEIVGGQLHRFVIRARGITASVKRIEEKRTYPTWSGEPFPYLLDMAGNVIARKITLTGKIENSEMVSGTITGALLRTAASGARVEVDYQGWRTYDVNNVTRISIDANDTYGMSAIRWNKTNGSLAGSINGSNSLFQLLSQGDMQLVANGGTIFLQGGIDFTYASPVGLGISDISGLQSQLSSLSDKPSSSQAAGGMNFDPTTRNLKLYNVNGGLLASVNIP